MRSTFMGLETARRGLVAQQSALYTTGHNIANANTPGYSRQRVNLTASSPYPAVGLNRPQIPGQMGTGVEAGTVQRMRESFLDVQYRSENTKLGYWSARTDAFTKVEDIVNEPSDQGLAATMTELWQSFQDLAGSSENAGARGVVIERLQAVADTFNYMSDSLQTIKQDFGNQASVTVNAANSIIQKLFHVNEQISRIEPNGYLPNDLYDQRDQLVDELSQYVQISVEKKSSGGNAPDTAEGTFHISFTNNDGSKTDLVTKTGYSLLSFDSAAVDVNVPAGRAGSLHAIRHDAAGKPCEPCEPAEIPFADAAGNPIFPNGEIKGLIEAYGYAGTDGATAGVYQNMINDLDKFAYTFKTLLNDIHKTGFDADGNQGQDLYTTKAAPEAQPVWAGAASSLTLVQFSSKQLAASSSAPDGKTVNIGDGSNAGNLANIGTALLKPGTAITLLGSEKTYSIPENLPIRTGTLNSFYEGIIGRLGVESQQASRMAGNTEVLHASVAASRESVSSVSLDEEMTNLIKFQHAYNGAARMITVMDELLDKVINGMGTGGR